MDNFLGVWVQEAIELPVAVNLASILLPVLAVLPNAFCRKCDGTMYQRARPNQRAIFAAVSLPLPSQLATMSPL